MALASVPLAIIIAAIVQVLLSSHQLPYFNSLLTLLINYNHYFNKEKCVSIGSSIAKYPSLTVHL